MVDTDMRLVAFVDPEGNVVDHLVMPVRLGRKRRHRRGKTLVWIRVWRVLKVIFVK
jgi:hypothetical protein